MRPGQTVKDSADLHHRFLLTEEQLQVRDSQAKLLHINGPPGSGKTILLAERARRWLHEGRHVALVVGSPKLDLLLRHLAWTVCGEKVDVARFSSHRGYSDLLDCLNKTSIKDPVYVIVDEASANSPDLYDKLLDHVRTGRVRGLWSADTRPLPDERQRKLSDLDGSTVQLMLCLRCPQHIMTWTNIVKSEEDLPLLAPPVPVTRELGITVKIISHLDHPHSQSWNVCPSCSQDTRAFFASLGLQGNQAKSALRLSDVVVITTTSSCEGSRVAKWLCSLGLHAVAEEEWHRVYPVQSASVTLGSHDQIMEEARSRVLRGTDVEGKPVIHVVGCENFMGLEKPVVLLWHEDRKDEGQYDKITDVESENPRDDRLSQQRHSWFVAATRCQGRLAVMAATPSPLLSLLQSASTSKITRPLRHVSVRSHAQRRSRHLHTRASGVRGDRETLSPRSPTSAPPPGVPTTQTSASLHPPPQDLPSRPAKAPSAHSAAMPSKLLSPSSALSGATPFHSFPPSSVSFRTVPSQLFPPTSGASEATSSHSIMSYSAPFYHFPSPPAAFGAMPSHLSPSAYVPFGAMVSQTYPPPSAPVGAMPSNPLPPFLPHPGTMPPYAIPSFSAPSLAPPQATFPSHLHPETSSPTRPPGQAAPSPSRESRGAFKY